MNPVSIDRAASIIGVSSATIRNWVKAGHLTPANRKPLSLWEHEVIDLKTAIGSGAVSRLRARANKTSSQNTIIPKEYIGNESVIVTVNRISEIFIRLSLDIELTMFVATLRVMALSGEVMRIGDNLTCDISSFASWRRDSIRSEIYEWYSAMHKKADKIGYDEIYNSINDVGDNDFLGLLYQSLTAEGIRSNKGSYYTPYHVIRDSLSSHDFSGSSFLDPCCGTGNYLISAAKLLKALPENIYGFDSDHIAVRIARINLLLEFPNREFKPKIECLNSLTELATGEILCGTNSLIAGIDFIATNPPWGAYKNTSLALAHKSCGIKSNEAFSLFLAKSLSLLKENGFISFILPESILNIRTHSDIRSLILKTAKVVRIVKLGRQFSGVFTGVIRLDLIKGKADKNWVVQVQDGGNSYHIEQSRFLKNEYHFFDVYASSDEDSIIKKIYETEHKTLSGNADWALGIVTGNNEKYVHEKNLVGTEGVIRGSDICKYIIQEPRSYIRFDPKEFQQVAKEAMYRAPEKLIYKFISKSLVFAYDNRQRLTLNSANILIPKIKGIGIKVVLAFLNSSVFQYIFKKKFSTHKVLRGDIEKFPFPVLTDHQHMEIEGLVDLIHSGADKVEELDNLIMSIYGLSNDEINIIKRGAKEN